MASADANETDNIVQKVRTRNKMLQVNQIKSRKVSRKNTMRFLHFFNLEFSDILRDTKHKD
jgi:hypothetical protein